MRYLAAVFLIFLASCTVIDVRNTTAFNRDAVSHQTLRDIDRGKTRADWVLDRLGYPDNITREPDHTEVWHYRVEERRANLYRVILVFQYRSTQISERNLYVKVADEVVMDMWGDFDYSAGPRAGGSPVINRKKRGRTPTGKAMASRVVSSAEGSVEDPAEGSTKKAEGSTKKAEGSSE